MKRGSEPGYSREIMIHGRGKLLPPGQYAVVFKTDGEFRVYSDLTFVSPPPGLTPNAEDSEHNPIVQYNFTLFRDCDHDNVFDTTQTECGPCIADYTDDNNTCPIPNPDGGVGIEDLLFYLLAYNNGITLADVDDGSSTGTPDGGVGIEDLLYYLIRYNLGC